MTSWNSNLGRRIMQRRGPQQIVGAGAQSQPLPTHTKIVFRDFSGGLNKAVMPSSLPQSFAADLVDFQIDQRGRLATWPGVGVAETFTAPRSPDVMFAHGDSTTGATELVFIDGRFLGVKSDSATATVFTDLNLPLGGRWVSCMQGDQLVLSNGVGTVYTRDVGDSTVANAGWGPARALMSFAARVFGGAVTILGDYEPLGIFWTGATSLPSDVGAGSGFEILYDDTEGGDYIVAMRSIGFDFAAILTRRAVWVATRTGNSSRPADFSPRVWGQGAVNDACVVKVPQGIMFLSDSGVKLFDGNSITHMSDPIDADILPLQFNKINEYSAAYSPVTSEYVLFTPVGSFYYALNDRRWTKRSLKVLQGVSVYIDGSSSPISGAAVGGWGNDWNRSWGESSGGGGGGGGAVQSDLYYLVAGRLLVASNDTTYAGVPYLPTWESAELDTPDEIDGMYTIDNVSVRYTGGGNIQIYTPDYQGDWQLFRDATLPVATQSRTYDFYGNTTGKLMGLRLVVVNGRFNIEAIAARGLLRESRRWIE